MIKYHQKFICVIVTDGYENASMEYNHDKIKNLIKKCEDDNWSFIYLGANQDAFTVGSSLGISAGNTYYYTVDSTGVNNMYNAICNATVSYRAMSTTDADFKTISKSLINSNDDETSKE